MPISDMQSRLTVMISIAEFGDMDGSTSGEDDDADGEEKEIYSMESKVFIGMK